MRTQHHKTTGALVWRAAPHPHQNHREKETSASRGDAVPFHKFFYDHGDTPQHSSSWQPTPSASDICFLLFT
jgi:hypothetical protein